MSSVTGTIHSGSTVTGVGVPANTTIVKQTSEQTAKGTGTASGTNLTMSSVTGTIYSDGSTVTGAGVPANTTIVNQTSGTTGGAGVYVTSQATTASSAALSFAKPSGTTGRAGGAGVYVTSQVTTTSDAALSFVKPPGTYNVFFVYPKSTTQQTYQIYVGKNFDKKTLKPVRAQIDVAPITKFVDYTGPRGWLSDSLDENGVLTVSIDFSAVPELKKELDPSPANLCQPRSFCKPNASNTKCGCALGEDAKSHIKKQCESVCKT